MPTRAHVTLELLRWEEQPYDHGSEGGARLARASMHHVLSGDIEGEGWADYLLAYDDGGRAAYTGLTRVIGRVGERAGSFVLQEVGTFEESGARGRWTIVPGSCSGALAGLRGEGCYLALPGSAPSATLDYELD